MAAAEGEPEPYLDSCPDAPLRRRAGRDGQLRHRKPHGEYRDRVGRLVHKRHRPLRRGRGNDADSQRQPSTTETVHTNPASTQGHDYRRAERDHSTCGHLIVMPRTDGHARRVRTNRKATRPGQAAGSRRDNAQIRSAPCARVGSPPAVSSPRRDSDRSATADRPKPDLVQRALRSSLSARRRSRGGRARPGRGWRRTTHRGRRTAARGCGPVR